jgi:hypothetical protein
MTPSRRSKSSGFPPNDPAGNAPRKVFLLAADSSCQSRTVSRAALWCYGLTLSVLGNGNVQGCDLVHELLALFACGELIGYGGELVSDRQELLCKSVHEVSFLKV